MALRVVRHLGASFRPGRGLVHLWTAGSPDALAAAWRRTLVTRGLAAELRLGREPTGRVHGYAVTDPFLPLPVITAALEAGGRLPRPLRETLDFHADRGAAYRRSWALYGGTADRRGWVAWPLRLGFAHSLLLGMGRHARLLTMNVHEHVAAPLVLAGTQKDVGRDFLALHGLPVAPGDVVRDAPAAVDAARRLGFPVVLKRLAGGDADGVLYGIVDAATCRRGATALLARDEIVLVEKLVRGLELRLHFVRGRLHRVYRGVPVMVVGDGRHTLGALLRRRYPRYFALMAATPSSRQRLVGWLWGQGVRRFGDLARRIPPRGARIQVAPGVARRRRVAPRTVLSAADLARFEGLLRTYGGPSCGIDLVLPRPCAPLDTGAIFEINVPSGVGYLDDPARVARDEVREVARRAPGFVAAGGRTPLWLWLDAGSDDGWRRLRRQFRRRHPRGIEVTFGAPGAVTWPEILARRDARAFLVRLGADAILEHGLPMHSRPVLVVEGAVGRARHLVAWATVQHAGGRARRLR